MLLAALMVTALALVAVILLRITYHPQIGAGTTPESVACVQVGMTEEEVRNILGREPGDYRSFLVRHLGHHQLTSISFVAGSTSYGQHWQADGISVFVFFDDTRNVVHVAM
jgi:hypothetical protein